MKNSLRRLALAFTASSVFASAAVAQDAPQTQPPATPAPVAAGTLADNGGYGITIPPQNFPAPRNDTNRWDTDSRDSAPVIPPRPPRTENTGAINIGPISVREGSRDRLRPGCRWTVRDETLQRRCRF